MLGVYLFQVVFSIPERMVVNGSTRFTDENSMFQLKVSRLIAHAVDAVGIELIFGDSLL